MQANEPERMRTPVRNRGMIMKSKEELNALKKEVEALNKKLAELTGEELEQIASGIAPGRIYWKEKPVQNKGKNSGDGESNPEG